MPVSSENERLLREAMTRLVTGDRQKAPDDLLVDRNLIAESGVKKSTVYRCTTVMEEWRTEKETAVSAAIQIMVAKRSANPNLELTDTDLLRTARVDHASFSRMSDTVHDEWNRVKTESPPRSRLQLAKDNPDEVIRSLINKLYGVTLALRRANDVIARQASEIERLGGNVFPIGH